MSDSEAFESACLALEELTHMNRAETRGTVRICLREAGLDAARVTVRELATLAVSALPPELAARGVPDAMQVCEAMVDRIAGSADTDRVFEELAKAG